MLRAKKYWYVVLLCGFVSASTLALGDDEAAPQSGGQKTRNTVAETSSNDEPVQNVSGDPAAEGSDIEKEFKRLQVLSADLNVRLAELDLRKIENMNDKVAGLYSAEEVARYTTAIAMAKERLKAARERADGKNANAIVGMAEASLANAQQAYQRAVNANRRYSASYSPTDMEHFRVSVELAKARLAQAKVVDQLGSPVAIVGWELDELREQVRQLRWRITAITTRR